jgi:hypothetical protein
LPINLIGGVGGKLMVMQTAKQRKKGVRVKERLARGRQRKRLGVGEIEMAVPRVACRDLSLAKAALSAMGSGKRKGKK